MIPILYSNVEESLGGTWTEKKGSFQKNYFWNCETNTAVLTSYTGNYTAYDPIAVTPGKLYHVHGAKGSSAKQRFLLFVNSQNTILWKLEWTGSPVDTDVIAPSGAVYALITAGTKTDSYLNNVEFKEFSTGGAITNGLGRLSDCISCLVTEERNGKYEVEFTYPVSGIHYEDIQKGRVISVTHDETGTKQPFVIYRISAPINGIVTINAHHMSYDLSNAIVQPFTATSVADAFDQLVTKCMTINPFMFWTDNVTAGTMTSEVPASVRSLLGGTRGSILDVFGGEYEFDGYTVKNHASRGSDNGVTIRYGKNLTDIEDTSDISETYNAVVPYWSDGEDTVVFGGIVTAAGVEVVKAIALDLSGEWEEAPTVSDLESRAATYLSSNTPWIQKQNIKIDFVALWQTEEYKNIAPLERVTLCDTVHVIHPDLDINVTAKVIKTTWDVLADKYDSIELGEAKSSFADTILDGTKDALSTTLKQYAKTSAMTEAIDHATQLITGGLGGHIVFMYDADGLPTEMLVMDTDDVTTAVNVLRINVNGIGFSDSGINGPYDSAWTLDGQFVADFITAGTMSANRIQGGTLTLGGVDNGNGVLVVYDASNNEIGSWTKDGIELKAGVLTATEIRSPVPTQGSGYQARLVPETGSIDSVARGTFSIYSGYNTGTDKLTLWHTGIKGSGRLSIQGDTNSQITMDNGSILIQNNLTGHNSSMSFRSDGDIWAYAANIWLNGQVRIGVTSPPSYYSPVVMDSNGNLYRNLSTSSKRYKHDIKGIEEKSLDPKNLYNVRVVQYVYNDDVPVPEARKGKKLIGFVAEQLAENFPVAAIYGEGEKVESWEPFFMIPPILALIQEQKKQLDAQEKRIKALEKKFEILMEALEENG